MKQLLILMGLLFLLPSAQADLLDRVRLEDSLRERIENVFKIYDPNSKILIRFDYKNYSGVLPGTGIESQGDINPYKVESSDVARVTVEVYTEIQDVPAEAKEVVFKVIPVEKNKVTVEYKKLKNLLPKDKEIVKPTLDPQSLQTIANDSVQSFSKNFYALFAGTLLIFLAFMLHQNNKKLKEFRQHVSVLTAALAESKNAMPLAPAPAAAVTRQNNPTFSGGSKDQKPLAKLATASLLELFADCYWCQEDEYASWLWKNLESDQKRDVLAQLSFMKDYSQYFVDQVPMELSHHEHPYYLEPKGLLLTSQVDLATLVKKDYGLWSHLSPLRQLTLPLGLEERIKASQASRSAGSALQSATKSSLRVLESKLSWGDLTLEDEALLFAQPELVPLTLRENIKSLVWLAKKEDAFIQKVLNKYDARTLATAWVGPEEVLKRLESFLPEKKLKLLLTYKEKTLASRHTDAYLSLVAEGHKSDAA